MSTLENGMIAAEIGLPVAALLGVALSPRLRPVFHGCLLGAMPFLAGYAVADLSCDDVRDGCGYALAGAIVLFPVYMVLTLVGALVGFTMVFGDTTDGDAPRAFHPEKSP